MIISLCRFLSAQKYYKIENLEHELMSSEEQQKDLMEEQHKYNDSVELLGEELNHLYLENGNQFDIFRFGRKVKDFKKRMVGNTSISVSRTFPLNTVTTLYNLYFVCKHI